jgi:hypothetical protein
MASKTVKKSRPAWFACPVFYPINNAAKNRDARDKALNYQSFKAVEEIILIAP